MKVAILVCGLPRTFKVASKTFSRAFGHLNADTFVHTWQVPLKPSIKIHKNIDNATLLSAEEIKQCFNASSVVIDQQSEDIEGLIKGHNEPYPNNVVCFHESINRCLNSVKEAEKYDLFIMTRHDIFYKERITLPDIKDGEVWTPRINNIHSGKQILQRMKNAHPGSVCDIVYGGICVAKFDEMKLLGNFSREYVSLCQDEKYFLSGKVDYFPDRALAIYLKNEKKLAVREFIFRHGIVREDHVQEYCW